MVVWSLSWEHGSLEVHSLGGMVAPIRFKLNGSREVVPFRVAPWVDDPISKKVHLPGILHNLRGEWPCVPFGAPRKIDALRQDLFCMDEPLVEQSVEQSEYPHGYSSNNEWKLVSTDLETIVIECNYPTTSAIESLRRVVRVDPSAPRVDFELEIRMRTTTDVPMGLHPTFDVEGGIRLMPGSFKFGMTFPGNLEPSSQTEPGATFTSLKEVPHKDATSADLTTLPLSDKTETLLQLCGIDGTFEVHHLSQGFISRVTNWIFHLNLVVVLGFAALPLCIIVDLQRWKT
eukprot:TRINITY_DN8688_c0_g1_i1.p1 TRINITY_DN8688_c0_g1~~TRINITY_DN8688_c0_g1_i1.p1  ORF type:complete len:288 (-),score=23.87 TRINITY_DN8688_c0_g1_i1:272-1135(-)